VCCCTKPKLLEVVIIYLKGKTPIDWQRWDFSAPLFGSEDVVTDVWHVWIYMIKINVEPCPELLTVVALNVFFF